MTIYDFRCPACGDFEAVYSMRDVPRETPCPECQAPAAKLVSAGNFARAGDPRTRAIDAAARSAHEPPVVSGPVGRRRATPTTQDPRHAKLPRP